MKNTLFIFISLLIYSTQMTAQIGGTNELPNEINPALMVFPYLNVSEYLNSDEITARTDSLVQLGIGGFIVRVESIEDVKTAIERLQNKARTPLLFCADLEAGTFYQTHPDFNLHSLMAWGAVNDTAATYRYASLVARLCVYLGIHLNLAPVVDVNTNPENSVIGTRSFGDDPSFVSNHARAYMRAMMDHGIIPVYKHFPGHGGTREDSHYELPVIQKSAAELQAFELVPYREGIAEGLPCIMMGHLALPQIDSAAIASSLSKQLTQHYLRDTLQFKGAIITDGLQMRAVKDHFTDSAIVVNACLAGNNILLAPGEPFSVVRYLSSALNSGVLSEEIIRSSVRLIDELKRWDRQHRIKAQYSFADLSADFRQTAAGIAGKSITLVRDPNRLFSHGRVAAENSSVFVLANKSTEATAEEFIREMKNINPEIEIKTATTSKYAPELLSTIPPPESGSTIIVISFLRGNIFADSSTAGTIGSFLKTAFAPKQKGIFISLKDPYASNYAPDFITCANVFNYNKLSIDALSDKLFNSSPFSGTSPVKLHQPQLLKSRQNPEDVPFTLEEQSDQRFTMLEGLLRNAVSEQVFPGGTVLVAQHGEKLFQGAFGRYTYSPESQKTGINTLFDLASVSKVAATTTAAMLLFDNGKLELDKLVAGYLPEFAKNGKADITIRNLLSHNSGLPAFKPFYKTCSTAAEVIEEIYQTPLSYPTGTKTLYSDLGMITLGKVIERISGLPLDEFCAKNIFKPLGMNSTKYNPSPAEQTRCAPTEYDSVWRHAQVQGTVHDEASALLGGVAGHAGLFSNSSDLGCLLQMLLNDGMHNGKRFLSGETIRLFTSRQNDTISRALGWDTRLGTGNSAGTLMSAKAFGHTGFTGTSVWVDPVNDCYVILLTNRVYPTRQNTKIIAFRPKLHDTVLRILHGE